MLMRHEFCAAGRLDPDDVRPGLRGMANDDGKTHRRWKRRKRLPVDVFRQDRFEDGLAWLMGAGHVSLRVRHLQWLKVRLIAAASYPAWNSEMKRDQRLLHSRDSTGARLRRFSRPRFAPTNTNTSLAGLLPRLRHACRVPFCTTISPH